MKPANFDLICSLMAKRKLVSEKHEKLELMQCARIDLIGENNSAAIVIDEPELQQFRNAMYLMTVDFFEKEVKKIDDDLKPL